MRPARNLSRSSVSSSDQCRSSTTRTHASLAAANRDPTRTPDAAELDLERNQRHLAFGHGTHFCLGAPLARMEGRIGLATLLHRFPELRLAVPVEDLHWDRGDG